MLSDSGGEGPNLMGFLCLSYLLLYQTPEMKPTRLTLRACPFPTRFLIFFLGNVKALV